MAVEIKEVNQLHLGLFLQLGHKLLQVDDFREDLLAFCFEFPV